MSENTVVARAKAAWRRRCFFMTVQRWRTRADADQHMTTPHVQTLLAAIGPLLAAPPEITVMREV
jgi:quinol monooxygenase YgiN